MKKIEKNHFLVKGIDWLIIIFRIQETFKTKVMIVYCEI